MRKRILAIAAGASMAAVLFLGINQVLLRRDIDELEQRLATITTQTLPRTEQAATKTCELDRQLQEIDSWMAVQAGAASGGGIYIAPEWCNEG